MFHSIVLLYNISYCTIIEDAISSQNKGGQSGKYRDGLHIGITKKILSCKYDKTVTFSNGKNTKMTWAKR